MGFRDETLESIASLNGNQTGLSDYSYEGVQLHASPSFSLPSQVLHPSPRGLPVCNGGGMLIL